jgi:hypothetical protein
LSTNFPHKGQTTFSSVIFKEIPSFEKGCDIRGEKNKEFLKNLR